MAGMKWRMCLSLNRRVLEVGTFFLLVLFNQSY